MRTKTFIACFCKAYPQISLEFRIFLRIKVGKYLSKRGIVDRHRYWDSLCEEIYDIMTGGDPYTHEDALWLAQTINNYVEYNDGSLKNFLGEYHSIFNGPPEFDSFFMRIYATVEAKRRIREDRTEDLLMLLRAVQFRKNFSDNTLGYTLRSIELLTE